MTDNWEAEWEAEAFVQQMQEWMNHCPKMDRCPAARLYTYLRTLKEKIDRLQGELNRCREFPDET